jgi:aryl-alcohol dehydrogenase-like predicted oxidoreductase
MIRKLGQQVSRLGFGAFRVNNETHGEALRKALVSGVNVIDTAANFESGMCKVRLNSKHGFVVDSQTDMARKLGKDHRRYPKEYDKQQRDISRREWDNEEPSC